LRSIDYYPIVPCIVHHRRDVGTYTKGAIVVNDESGTSLWDKRKLVDSPKMGPYADLRVALLEIFAEAKKLSLLQKVSRDTYQFQSRTYVIDCYVTVELRINLRTNELKVAVGTSQEGGETHYYSIADTGHGVDLSDLSSEMDWKYLKPSMYAALKDLQQKVDHKRRREQERLHDRRRNLIIVAFILALVTAGFFCIRWWVFEPQEAANRARITYDAGNHQIDRVGYPVDSHALAVVPSGTLQSIPSYGGDDKVLTHPRTLTTNYSSSSNWCSTITTDIPSGTALTVAVEEDSLFARDHYVATYADRKLTVCLVDGFVRNDASKTVTAKLVLQVKPQAELR
jgi:hypothetical protein